VDEMKRWTPGYDDIDRFCYYSGLCYSVATVIGLRGMDFFWELATLILIMLLGHWIENEMPLPGIKRTGVISTTMPSDAHMVHGDHVMDVKTESLKRK
jgi:Cu2+-exporting ATPase